MIHSRVKQTSLTSEEYIVSPVLGVPWQTAQMEYTNHNIKHEKRFSIRGSVIQ